MRRPFSSSSSSSSSSWFSSLTLTQLLLLGGTAIALLLTIGSIGFAHYQIQLYHDLKNASRGSHPYQIRSSHSNVVITSSPSSPSSSSHIIDTIPVSDPLIKSSPSSSRSDLIKKLIRMREEAKISVSDQKPVATKEEESTTTTTTTTTTTPVVTLSTSPVVAIPPLVPGTIIPLLLFTFNRPENLRRTLDSLIEHRPLHDSSSSNSPHPYPIYISQDGDDPPTRAIAEEYANRALKERNANSAPDVIARYDAIYYMRFDWASQHVTIEPQHMQWGLYYKIASHYGWALRQIMDAGGRLDSPPVASPSTTHLPLRKHDQVILVEDDMLVAPDFYSYFTRLLPVLNADESLYCISAWNDNGRTPLVSSSSQLYRSDCFPGLGWLLSRRIWNEFTTKWPKGFWDDWMREPEQRKGRACIYPEVNRVYTFGEKGASAGQYYNEYLRDIRLNTESLDWPSLDISYISSLPSYESYLHSRISTSHKVAFPDISLAGATIVPLEKSQERHDELRIEYQNDAQRDAIMQQATLMLNHKAGVPRTAFQGVMAFSLPQKKSRVWILPQDSKFIKST